MKLTAAETLKRADEALEHLGEEGIGIGDECVTCVQAISIFKTLRNAVAVAAAQEAEAKFGRPRLKMR